jgi:hypothetical protein
VVKRNVAGPSELLGLHQVAAIELQYPAGDVMPALTSRKVGPAAVGRTA